MKHIDQAPTRNQGDCDRSALSSAWVEGFSAGKNGLPQLSNPYKKSNYAKLAKEWDVGWQEGFNR